MRPPLSSRSSTKSRGSKIRACPQSDLSEFLFWWHNCYWDEKKKKNPYQISRISFGEILQELAEKLFLISFPCFQCIRRICKTRFSLSQKTQKMLKTKKLPWQPLLFSILKVSSSQNIPVLSISENFTEGNWKKLKSKPNRRQKRAMFK